MQVSGHTIFLIWFWVTLIGVLWIPVTWILLSIFTPKTLLEKYFKEPHFTLTETILMAQFPGFLLRTGIFAWLLLIPKVDKKRKIKNVKRYIPRWYAFALNTFTIGMIITFLLFLSTMGFLVVFDPPV